MQDREFEIIALAVEQHMKSATAAIIASILNISEAAGDHSEQPE